MDRFPLSGKWGEKTFGTDWDRIKNYEEALYSFRPIFDYEAFADSEYDGFRVTQRVIYDGDMFKHIWKKKSSIRDYYFSPFRNFDVETIFWTRWCVEDSKEV